jgi:hypothetical protein
MSNNDNDNWEVSSTATENIEVNYTSHGRQRQQERRVDPIAVKRAVKRGQRYRGKGNTTMYKHGNDIVVGVKSESSTKVITVYKSMDMVDMDALVLDKGSTQWRETVVHPSQVVRPSFNVSVPEDHYFMGVVYDVQGKEMERGCSGRKLPEEQAIDSVFNILSEEIGYQVNYKDSFELMKSTSSLPVAYTALLHIESERDVIAVNAEERINPKTKNAPYVTIIIHGEKAVLMEAFSQQELQTADPHITGIALLPASEFKCELWSAKDYQHQSRYRDFGVVDDLPTTVDESNE